MDLTPKACNDKKRRALGIDKAREGVLMDMSDKRHLEAA